MRLAIIHNGKVENITSVLNSWTGSGGEWKPAEGREAVSSETARIGDSYENGEFISPPEPERPPVLRQFTKLEVIEAMFVLIGETDTYTALDGMKGANRRVFERWSAATRIDEDDPDFLAQLSAMQITLDELKATIDA